MSRGFVHEFDVVASTLDDPVVDEEGRWESDTIVQHVRGSLGSGAEIARDVANPEAFDLVALVPTDTTLTSPVTVRVLVAIPGVAEPGDYVVQRQQPLRIHTRLLCVKQRPEGA